MNWLGGTHWADSDAATMPTAAWESRARCMGARMVGCILRHADRTTIPGPDGCGGARGPPAARSLRREWPSAVLGAADADRRGLAALDDDLTGLLAGLE